MKVYAYLLVLSLAFAAWACQPSEQKTEEATEEKTEEVTEEKSAYPADSVAADSSMSFHGFRIDGEGVISSEEALAMLEEKGELAGIKVSGNVDQVCQMRGCWMDMSLVEGKQVHVRFNNGNLSTRIGGYKEAVILESHVEDIRHKAEDGGMDPEEAAKKYTEPQAQLAFEATGVIIKDQEGK